jgi:hypothetical protein
MKALPRWIWGFVGLALVASLVAVGMRHKVEAKNRAVGLAVEYPILVDAAALEGKSPAEALLQIKNSGLNMVVLSEQTIGDKISDGSLILGAGQTLVGSGELLTRVALAIESRGMRPDLRLNQNSKGSLQVPGIPLSVVRGISLGLDPDEARTIGAAGIPIIARHNNFANISEDQITATISNSARFGAVGFLPQGEQVIGFRKNVKFLMDTLKANKMYYASPEFAKMAGDTIAVAYAPDHVVRLHAIQAAEIDRMSPQEAIERYARAYSERNQRILLIRPFALAEKPGLASLSSSVMQVAKAVTKEGGTITTPRIWEDPNVPTALLALIAIGVIGTMFGLVIGLVSNQNLGYVVHLVLALIAAYSFAKSDMGYIALIASIGFPVLAYLSLGDVLKNRPVLVQFLVMTLISLIGGLCIAGLMTGPVYSVKGDSFSAVKLAHFGPILIVAFLAAKSARDWNETLKSPLTLSTVFWGLGILGALGFMLARTGNDNPGAVSGIEMQFRSLLENLFVTRPRTKEFMIGHPAMLVGLALLAASPKAGESKKMLLASLGSLAVTLGMIGQTSIVNTLCHLHTPVMTGLIRILVGLILGLIVGAVALGFLRAPMAKMVEEKS